MRKNRKNDELEKSSLQETTQACHGVCLFEFGDTKVSQHLCGFVQTQMDGKDAAQGWVTAEYSLLRLPQIQDASAKEQVFQAALRKSKTYRQKPAGMCGFKKDA